MGRGKNAWRVACLAFFLAMLIPLGICPAQPAKEWGPNLAMGFTPAGEQIKGEKVMSDKAAQNFDAVSLDSEVQTACSPGFEAFDTSVKGIRINAPEMVEAVFDYDANAVSSSTRFPVCIAMQFPLKLMVDIPQPRSLVTLVMVNRATAESYAANLSYSRPMAPSPRAVLPEEVVEKAAQRFYYNVNLCRYVRLPATPATYFLYATFQDHKSNVLTVKVLENK